ncbi:response regulator [Sphingomonas sp. JC676]|uniref:response regulator n=1 Tax=Sphingomonas sp. JC676 TaxID=2768065 RepID=UPI0016584765|nr:response regulator [Sphingomonas sp. JC676]MBC9033815.1 response regulator [Sphingomonas sp. JC676]
MVDQRIAEGRRVLVVEDEMTIALVIEEALSDLGVQVVGPASRLDMALRLAREERIDAAILDVNIRGGNSYPIADILTERGIPFLFCSGYGEWALEERHRERPRLTKPYSSKDLESRVLELFGWPDR